MRNLKTKSLSPKFADTNVLDKSSARRFISFEAAILAFTEEYNIKEKPVGYNITEQGIEILYD